MAQLSISAVTTAAMVVLTIMIQKLTFSLKWQNHVVGTRIRTKSCPANPPYIRFLNTGSPPTKTNNAMTDKLTHMYVLVIANSILKSGNNSFQ